MKDLVIVPAGTALVIEITTILTAYGRYLFEAIELRAGRRTVTEEFCEFPSTIVLTNYLDDIATFFKTR